MRRSMLRQRDRRVFAVVRPAGARKLASWELQTALPAPGKAVRANSVSCLLASRPPAQRSSDAAEFLQRPALPAMSPERNELAVQPWEILQAQLPDQRLVCVAPLRWFHSTLSLEAAPPRKTHPKTP